MGILVTDNDAAASAGVDNGNSFTLRRAYEAAVAAWNARGGLAGRRIVPVYVEVASSSASYSNDLEQACATFVHDRHVALVASATGVYDEQFGSCLAKAGIPWLPGDYALGDDQALTSSPTLVTPSTITTDARMSVLLRQLVRAGRLSKSGKLGVVVEGCPFNQRTFDRTVVPQAKHLGVPVTEHVVTRCFGGIGELSGLAADLQGVVLRFQSSHVTDVVFVSGAMEGNLVLFFTTAAQGQQYHPRYGLTSAAIPVVQEENSPPEQLHNAVGVGWLPEIDIDRPGAARPAQASCLTDLRRNGLAATSAADRFSAFGACDTLALVDMLLRRSFGSTKGLVSAAGSLGDAFTGALVHAGTTDFGGGRRTGPSTGRMFGWSNSCDCFDYDGPAFSLNPSV